MSPEAPLIAFSVEPDAAGPETLAELARLVRDLLEPGDEALAEALEVALVDACAAARGRLHLTASGEPGARLLELRAPGLLTPRATPGLAPGSTEPGAWRFKAGSG